jgi:hydrogenase/urease accessory protein HupE
MTLPNERGARVRFPPPLVFLGAILLGVLVQFKGVRLSLPFAPGLRIATGVIILICAVTLVVSARICSRAQGRALFRGSPRRS